MKVNREQLLQEIGEVKPGLGNGTAVQNSDCLTFHKGKVRSFNDQVSIQHPCCLKIDATVKAEPFFQLLSRLVDEELEVECSESLTVSTKRSKASLTLEQIENPMEVKLPKQTIPIVKGMNEALSFCQFSAGKDMSRAELINIHLHKNIVESCDGFRLTRYKMKKFLPSELFIPASIVKDLVGYEVSSYGETEGWIHFLGESGLVFSCRTTKNKYPDLDALCNVEGTKLQLPKGMTKAIERAEIFSETEFGQDGQVTVTILERKLILEGKNVYGKYRERLPLKYKGDTIQFVIHPSLLKELLALHSEIIIGAANKNGTGRLKIQGDNFEHVAVTQVVGE